MDGEFENPRVIMPVRLTLNTTAESDHVQDIELQIIVIVREPYGGL